MRRLASLNKLKRQLTLYVLLNQGPPLRVELGPQSFLAAARLAAVAAS
jgi:hypothetical protein